MSRRIIFAALAASAALIATQAIADRECFEDSCRVPEAAEPPAPAVTKSETSPAEPQAAQAQAQAEPLPSASQASAIPEQVPPEITVTEIPAPAKPVGPPAAQAPQAAEARAESKPAPVSALPKVVAEPAPLKPAAEPAPRYTPPQVSTRAEDARTRSQMLGRATDNISPVESAAVPTQGKSLRWPIMIVTLLIAGIVSIGAGLSRGLMRRSFPTPSSAARTLETPVLAVLPRAAKAKPPKHTKAPRPAKKGKPELVLVEGGA